MRPWLSTAVLLAGIVAAHPAAAVVTQTLWLDASDATTFTLNGNVVDVWRDKSGLHNDLTRDSGGPLAFGGGVELVERTSGIVDRLQGTGMIATGNEAMLMFLVCRPYPEVGRLFSFDSNNMSVLQRGNIGDDLFGFQINNATACENPYPNAGIGGIQVYVMSRVPNGTGQDVTMERLGGGQLNLTVPCFHEPLQGLRFDNGGTSFPTNPNHGMIIFEVRCYSASVAAPQVRGLQAVESPFDEAFIQATLNELGVKWNVNQPIPVKPSTWSGIKLRGR